MTSTTRSKRTWVSAESGQNGADSGSGCLQRRPKELAKWRKAREFEGAIGISLHAPSFLFNSWASPRFPFDSFSPFFRKISCPPGKNFFWEIAFYGKTGL